MGAIVGIFGENEEMECFVCFVFNFVRLRLHNCTGDNIWDCFELL